MTAVIQTRTAERVERTTYSMPASGQGPELGSNFDVGTSDWAIQGGWKTRRFGADARAIHAGDNQQATKRDHRKWFAEQLARIGAKNRQRDGRELLTELATEFGFAWTDVARLIGVSVPAIRKWRMSGGIAGENAARLADLVSFAGLLRTEMKISSPAAWFNTPMVPGYTIAPKHIYASDQCAAILDYLDGNIDVRSFLDEACPGWAEDYDAMGYEVQKFEDGSFGIVRSAQTNG